MTAENTHDREAASKINPFIGAGVRETCWEVSIALKGLSDIFCENEKGLLPSQESLSLLQRQLDMFAAALNWESEQDNEAKPQPSEATMKRVK
ncbi:MAG: hypothetical protein ACREX9_22620 [Gammaproteobacteria bacterium]